VTDPKATAFPCASRTSEVPIAIVFPTRTTAPCAVMTPPATGLSRLTLYSTVVIRYGAGRTERTAVATEMSARIPITPP